jgi:ABC-type multidrug transport system fused ATPase/permease subunit
MFAYSGGNLTKRIRSKTFRAILRQDIAYFDQTNHNTGALCARLSTEASIVQNAGGARFGFLFQNLVSISVGIIIGMVYSWQLTLLILAFIPLVLFGAYAQIRISARFADKDNIFVDDAGKV